MTVQFIFGQGNWPSYTGGGNYLPEQMDNMVGSVESIKLLWDGPEHFGFAKGKSSAEVNGKDVEAAAELGIEAHPGGSCTPIVAEDKVFMWYFRPTGEVKIDNDHEKNELIKKILADDILYAVDVNTGDSLWKVVETGKGLNRGGRKRDHYGVTPVYHNGVVYTMGTTGLLYAYKAENGEKLWEKEVPGLHQRMLEAKQEALTEKKLVTEGWRVSLTVAGGVLIAPTYEGRAVGLQGFSLENGEPLWKVPEAISRWATPTIWHKGEKEYLLTGTEDGEIRLIDPVEGEVIWKQNEGPNLPSLVMNGDYAIFNSKPDPEQTGNGLYGCYKISLEGAEMVWQLPNEPDFMHQWNGSDNAATRWISVRDDIAIVLLKPSPNSGRDKYDIRVLMVRLEENEILYDYRMDQGGPETSSQRIRMPYFLGDYLMLFTDQNHGQGGYGAYYYKIEPNNLAYLGEFPIQHYAMTSYETPIEIPFANGMFIFRSIKGIAAYGMTTETTSLHFSQPHNLNTRKSDRFQSGPVLFIKPGSTEMIKANGVWVHH